jgi:uroporphyrinogen decarboxylase
MTSKVLIAAARREQADHTPVWFMRQAGRILPEYRRIKERFSLLEISAQPDLCAEVTLQPLKRMPLDAAIVYADIMTPLVGIGIDLDIRQEIGPVIAQPIRKLSDVSRLRAIDPAADVPYLLETLRLVKAELAPEQALIGFAGAPFTLASYLVEGRGTRTFLLTKQMMYSAPDVWHAMMTRLADVVAAYLRAQVRAGADILQLFDSWVGALGPDDYARYCAPYTRRIFAALADCGVPLIHFAMGGSTFLDQIREDGADVIGLDWRIHLDDGWRIAGADRAVQGNLDPAALLGPWEVVEEKADDVLRRAGGRAGHIFNLGHGLHPVTPLDNVIRLANHVREASTRQGARV